MKWYIEIGIMLTLFLLSTACATPDTSGVQSTMFDAQRQTAPDKAAEEVQDMSEIIKCGRDPECAKKWRKEIYPDTQ